MSDESVDVGPEALGLLSGLETAAPPDNYDHWDRMRDFRAIFLGSLQGRRVLYQIIDHCAPLRSEIQRVAAGTDVPASFRAMGFADVAKWLLRVLIKEPLEQASSTISETSEE